ncbi:MAG TPA: helix-turn-helix domain-containing protein [Nocardioides sp.]|uniref:TetR/AcrR family transcriptional regulator n=1 Tax=Nocardioides sp. TaxID=35761 RepID=UPI002E35EE5B|nr:helix-turn-helix domain-containing protein [Nocardioides sp.]HEX5091005.1 helix-turn-helix domain-containing protein [Nocardioides sp.]
MARRYEMSARERARAATREEILDAAVELFGPAWFDEVTLADVAKRAGVSQQTVVNHFGSKIDLYLTAIGERVAPRLAAARAGVTPGDVDAIVACVVRDYEESGDGNIRIVALAGRLAELREVLRRGRAWHRAWVEEVFAPQLARRRGATRERVLTLLVTVLDVTTWKTLRRDEGLDPKQTELHLKALVEGVLAA